MNVSRTDLAGVVVIERTAYPDNRGHFVEISRQNAASSELGVDFVQTNCSRSTAGVLRGLHAQIAEPQGKLVSVVRGRIWDVAVDIDPASAGFGRWYGMYLDDVEHRQLYVPPGFAHGFVVLSDEADVLYQCTAYYNPGDELCLLWSDPDLAIEWPVAEPVISDKDRAGMGWADYCARNTSAAVTGA